MSKKLIPVERRQQILNYLQQHGVAKSSTLIELFNSSEATIRRDMEWLERHHLVERTHGGAILLQSMQQEAIYNASASFNQQEKKWIAQEAIHFIDNGDMVFINNGTTATAVINALHDHSDLKDVTIATNNVSAAMAAQDLDVKVILLGGVFRPLSTSLVGSFTVQNLQQLYANKAILGMDGVSNRLGCTSPIQEEAEISRVMRARCLGQSVIVADHSKWGKVAQYHIADLTEFDVFISDSGLSEEALESLEDNEIEVILAGPRKDEAVA